MATGALIGLTAGTMALGAYSSAQQAQAANRFARQQDAFNIQVQAGQTQAARIQSRQIEAQGALEKLKTNRMAHQVRSTLRVGAGERLGEGQTFEALMRQADLDEAITVEIIERNVQMARESVFSRIQPLPPSAPSRDVGLAAILGGLGGVQSGLSIGTSGFSLARSMRSPGRTGGTA